MIAALIILNFLGYSKTKDNQNSLNKEAKGRFRVGRLSEEGVVEGVEGELYGAGVGGGVGEGIGGRDGEVEVGLEVGTGVFQILLGFRLILTESRLALNISFA